MDKEVMPVIGCDQQDPYTLERIRDPGDILSESVAKSRVCDGKEERGNWSEKDPDLCEVTPYDFCR